MQTHTNVVKAGSWNCALTLRTTSSRPSTLPSSMSGSSSPPGTPIMRLTCPTMPPRPALSPTSFPRPFSSSVGKLSSRSVWPVGAVSKTMAE